MSTTLTQLPEPMEKLNSTSFNLLKRASRIVDPFWASCNTLYMFRCFVTHRPKEGNSLDFVGTSACPLSLRYSRRLAYISSHLLTCRGDRSAPLTFAACPVPKEIVSKLANPFASQLNNIRRQANFRSPMQDLKPMSVSIIICLFNLLLLLQLLVSHCLILRRWLFTHCPRDGFWS